MNYRKVVWLLILFGTLLRIVVGGALELGNDEVYYWTYALHLQWNYFDHPPMVALLIRLSTANLYFHQELFMRLGPILCAAINTWLIFLIARRIANERAGAFAALLYTSSFYCSIIAGTFILPDSPQLFFWIVSILLMTKIIDVVGPYQHYFLLLLGITIGLCIMSKVHGIFLWFGFGGYIVFHHRAVLKNPYLYIGLVITLVVISPIFIWNWNNHFVNYSFHNGRVGIVGKKMDPSSFFQHLLGSVFYNNPINFIMYCFSIPAMAIRAERPRWVRLYLWLGLPLIFVLLIMSLFNETLPHWSGPAFISLLLLSAVQISMKTPSAIKIPGAISAGLILFLVIIAAGVPFIRWFPGTPGKKEVLEYGDGDITLDMVGWKPFSKAFDSLYRADLQSTTMGPRSWIISDNWFPAAHLDYYVAHPLGLTTMAVGTLGHIHQFAWLNAINPPPRLGSDAYFIYPSNYYKPPNRQITSCFATFDSLIVPQLRMHKLARNFVIYRLHGYQGGIPPGGVTSQ